MQVPRARINKLHCAEKKHDTTRHKWIKCAAHRFDRYINTRAVGSENIESSYWLSDSVPFILNCCRIRYGKPIDMRRLKGVVCDSIIRLIGMKSMKNEAGNNVVIIQCRYFGEHIQVVCKMCVPNIYINNSGVIDLNICVLLMHK